MTPSIRELHQRMLTSMSDDELRTVVLYLSAERNDPTMRYENLGTNFNERILRLITVCRERRSLAALVVTINDSLPFVLNIAPALATAWEQWAVAEDANWSVAPAVAPALPLLVPDKRARLCRPASYFRLLAGLTIVALLTLLLVFATHSSTPVNAQGNPRFYTAGIAPLFGNASTMFTVNIAGFSPLEPLTLWFTAPDGTPFYPSANLAYIADAVGNFSFQFEPSASFATLAPGLWTFTAYGIRSGEMTVTYFTISL